jgi:hypothetical protein
MTSKPQLRKIALGPHANHTARAMRDGLRGTGSRVCRDARDELGPDSSPMRVYACVCARGSSLLRKTVPAVPVFCGAGSKAVKFPPGNRPCYRLWCVPLCPWLERVERRAVFAVDGFHLVTMSWLSRRVSPLPQSFHVNYQTSGCGVLVTTSPYPLSKETFSR